MARGQIKVDTELSTRTASERVQPVDVGSKNTLAVDSSSGTKMSTAVSLDDGASNGFESIARTLAGLGDQVGRLADHAAAKEGEFEGRLAGMDPEFRPRRDYSIRSDAFDRAGLDVANARLKQEIDASLDRAFDQHGGNPAHMEKATAGIARGLVANAPEELQPGLQLYVGAKHLANMREATRRHIAETRANQAAALQDEMATSLRSLHQNATRLGLDADADSVLAAQIKEINALAGRRGLDGRPLLEPGTALRVRREAEHTVAAARTMGAFERLDGPAARKEFIDRFEDDWKNSRGIAAQFDFNQQRAMRSMLESELRHDEARRDIGARTLKQGVTDIFKMAEKGYAARPEELARLKAEVARSGSAELGVMLQNAEVTLQRVAGERTMTPDALEQRILQDEARLQSAGAIPIEIASLEASRGLLKEMRRALNEDQLGWAQRIGYPIKPLDTSSAANLTLSLRERIQAAEAVADHYGRSPVYVRPQEVKTLIAAAAPGGDALVQVVTAVRDGAGDRAGAVLRAVFKESPTLAVVGGLTLATRGSPGEPPLPVVKDVADGVHMTQLKEVKQLAPPIFQARQWAAGAHEGALAGSPENEHALIEATNYAYNLRLQKARKTEDARLWRQTFRELIGERQISGATYGGITKYRGQALVVPPDVRQDAFAELVAEIRPEDFGSSGPRNSRGPATAAQIGQARLESVGNGRYRMNVGEPDYPLYLVDENNQPFVLDLNWLKPRLSQRRGDLYVDGARRPSPQSSLTGAP